ncbi:Sterol 3-beta-glucosyltransferase UGT80A2 [Fulvia fulva]|uniref:Sterol 3-beta-glucosyltransferase UGT80A2 n=1 Tax=Passalora fulva TaxID=5499 RepID=A0A9Q8PIG2_PASFU|nr:Sterol 3-beta-glucosyltransferase UGT80A2 [Fulvia fulva]KAK4626648.1 Sterol 3-beta-glucosyltransferase UGT80A2 [Fulvia fulva]KAK4627594.1 Sterol 3-beta-glucosyltransferase UGT80A2 [Fulvia fulva]UJO23121.1 Sterol 3-beta-glucosyltransferase UGT80A2 [Fulvia fulva]WPV13343.1 Sterol 3-beta-glucosyltransferase UGT80A2 [Fulvia fulva]WPV28558.1 Sterol 3-beta-glucosyltransferase UGT80A2 [Fulvia fulva]
MAPSDEPAQKGGREERELGQVPNEMLRQAAAAVAGENDATASERRHTGQDVPLEVAEGLDTTQTEHDVPPPAYGEDYGTVSQEQEGFGTKASVAEDGRVNIRIDQRNRRLSQLLVPSLAQLQRAADEEHAPPPPYIPPSLGGEEGIAPPPPMNVVIQVVGSRGDVQPFVALGKILKDRYGHRVRLATHPNFKDFITENGLEFFSIGGDPQALMAFMVKNPGLMPGFDTMRSGDVGMRRKEIGEYLKGCWRSCFETGEGLGIEATDQTIEDWTRQHADEDDYLHRPFVADCIIANPPSFAHVHIAEKMGIPLHVMFTMPYSPTQAFPHPLANIQSSNADTHLTNYISYALVDMLTWQGLGDVINRFRQRSLGLDAISLMWAPGMLQRLRIPHTYCWSPALIPKPKDWGANISISGFFFLDLASNYEPDPELKAFLDAGPPPVYIGFGSIVLDDPNGMTKMIFEAVEKIGQRALVSKGWGGVGADELGKPDNVFMLGNCPHDWLFKRVSCVVHHGGAGTTAAGITAGRPTLVVPFFGDQPFWGAMVARAGAGPEPIPHKQLTADNLAEGIQKCLEPQSQERAHELADKIARENGSELGAQSFHQFLDVDKLRCNLAPSRPAVWRIKRTQARLSVLAACTLAQEGLLDFNDLKLFRPREYETDEGPWDPITGGATALIGTMSTMMLGVADFPIETLKALNIHPDSKANKAKAQAAKEAEGKGKQPERSDSPGNSTRSGLEGRPSGDTAVHGSPSPSGTSTPRSGGDSALFSEPTSQPSSRSGSTFNVNESLAKLNTGSLSPGSGSRSSSMADALSGSLGGGNRPRSRSNSRKPSPKGSSSSNAGGMMQTATNTGKGVNRIIGAGLKSPMDFTMNLSKGFRNAPKLYGDTTVRPAEKVTDLKSGLRAATKEFGFGMYDGITGLVSQPVKGAAKEGAAGFFKGIGKGIGGIALKPGAAFFAIPGYTMKGIYKEVQKQFGSSVQNYIMAARTAQGFDEYHRASIEEKQDIIMRWKVLQKNLKKKRNPDELVRDILDEQMKKKEAWLESRRCGQDDKQTGRSRANSRTSAKSRGTDDPYQHDPENDMLAMGTSQSSSAAQEDQYRIAEERALEEAIRQSVAATSRGDSKEDARVAEGMRANMAEVQRTRTARAADDDDEDMRRAMAESAAEAERNQHESQRHDTELERALAQSLREQRGWQDSDDEQMVQSPISEATIPADEPPAYDPGHLAGTTQEEYERNHSEKPGRSEKTSAEQEEERIVMEYIKKQSVLEEENRKKAKAPQIQVNDEDDEELQRALKISMQGHGQHGEASGS